MVSAKTARKIQAIKGWDADTVEVVRCRYQGRDYVLTTVRDNETRFYHVMVEVVVRRRSKPSSYAEIRRGICITGELSKAQAKKITPANALDFIV